MRRNGDYAGARPVLTARGTLCSGHVAEQAAQTLAGVAANPESWLRAEVMTGGGGMPAFGERLDPAEIDAIVAYVMATFPPRS